MATTTEQLLQELENVALLLQKAQVNLKKCPKQRLTKGYVETRLQTIEEYWNKFTTTHYNLLKVVPKEKKNDIAYFVNEDYFVIEDLYLCLQGDLKDLMRSMINPRLSDVTGSTGTTFEGNVKLPRIQLPSFSGMYEDWTTFKDLFTSLVHNNSMLSKVQKLHYLKSSVSGEAAMLLKHIQVTECNYDQAWDLLRDRFGNKRLIVNSLLRKLITQRKIPAQTANNIKTLLDTTSECLNSLKNLNVSTDSWDPLIIFLTVLKLDPETHRDWEEFAYKDNLDELPNWEDLVKFLQTKFRTLELLAPPSREKLSRNKECTVHVSTTPAATKPRTCLKCKDNHTLCHCKEFTAMEPAERCEYVKTNQLCFNCLAPGHTAKKCRLNMSCRICHKRHHSLVHQQAQSNISNQQDNMQAKHHQIEQNQQQEAYIPAELSSHFTASTSTALLATALVPVSDTSGRMTVLRALVDQGSQATFISERAAQLLKLKRTPAQATVKGVGSTTTAVKHAAQIELRSRHDDSFKLQVKVYIMATRITTQLPSQTIPINNCSHLEGLKLADPSFNKPGRVDLLLGVEVCAQILRSEFIKGPPGSPCAQNTSLGWIIFGNVLNEGNNNDFIVMHHSLDLNKMLKAMWELDNEDKSKLTKDERKCEEIYQSTHSRTQHGQYIVKLPTKTNELKSIHGRTREIAMQRLYQLEKRLEKNATLKTEYIKVMEEYISMNHMEEVPKEEMNSDSYYLPHHAVVKEDKETTKVRIVFNASQKGNNYISLNDELLVGPQLQTDMRSLIMKFRMRKICFVADIQRMYRMILVTKEDRDLQRILWRNDPSQPVKDYRLTRVTFGTASAPYLAVRTLHQVADDEGAVCPDAAIMIKEDFYVDDLMASKDNLNEAIHTAKHLEAILQKGGFTLQKWCSNDANFLKQFDPAKRTTHAILDITIDGTITALGLRWNMGKDMFHYSLKLPLISKSITKRTILSDIQRLFDPLGWLAPAMLPTKLLIQRLWLQGTGWDEELDTTTREEWIALRESLQHLNGIEVQRWLGITDHKTAKIEVHGFCDASTKAYAAVAYVRVEHEEVITTQIIAAKTRVAPVKPVSLPRLELCAALLLSRLLKQIKTAMKITDSKIFAWSDSTIVLSWLLGDPTRWQVFVRNRVVEILDNTGTNWFHVQSSNNPADVASRGEHTLELKDDEKWWKGPKWLREKTIILTRPDKLTTSLERKEEIQTNTKVEEELSLETQFQHYDNLEELLKSITYCKRFLKGKKMRNKDTVITTQEIDEALKTCIKIAQRERFYEDIMNLKKKREVTGNSKLKLLKPYLDHENILRVGGRLRHADIAEDTKNPIILDNHTPAKPFLNSGVDFAGPYQILASKGRGIRTNKAYVAVFVCMATKALHLEMVGDLTTESFIGAFKRFVARRGRCSHIWSDQGRNFVGANKELADAWKEAKLEFDSIIAASLALDGTQWHFIPAYSPHIGGLWEAGVKSMKHHMKRILTNHLTYEEMTTLICQIEACLNSRPLSPIDDDDTENLTPLTPGHFLIGEAPITVPQPNLQDVTISHLSRWQHIQKLLGDFWQKWQAEYLTSLQQRPKWLKRCKELDIGNIVLIKNEQLPPGKWALGRIVTKYPGADGVTRVYGVKSGDSITKRSFNKLCPLPIDVDD
ncbi:uncharacterized protein LOC111350200 isoform X1 [Spodoptera litura]|uniref:Uncharacterized protein LOC111350200 isoform X1 n=1 Tax=Spodoptera litura TaxID=69820 RepID=A0A9J7DVH2_SPOLT|nr:uncharacterized protein LOC111350200 isoform X1 [Spodoptera litura]